MISEESVAQKKVKIINLNITDIVQVFDKEVHVHDM